MTADPLSRSSQALLSQYLSVLRRLTDLALLERTLLDAGSQPLPAALTGEQAALSMDYALLGGALKPRIRALRDAGLLDAEALEHGIRRLVALTKENQRHQTARQACTRTRVSAVMDALATPPGQDAEDTAITPPGPPPAGAIDPPRSWSGS